MNISEARNLLKSKSISPLELVEECEKNWKNKEHDLNAVITPMFEKAKEVAKKAVFDESKPLSCIPYAVKDNICVKGERLTCGSRILGEYRSLFESTATSRLASAGAIAVCKTNMDEFAMGSSGEYSAFGPTHNPLDKKLVPGGSSSGSSAAVAAGYSIFSLGSDTGGSVRQPAAFCGLSAIRPTYGTVSRYGLVAFTSSIDQIGPMAKNSIDALTVLKAMRGLDEKDSTSVEWLPVELPEKPVIGIPKELFELDIDPEIMALLQECKKKLEGTGARFIEVSIPNLKHSVATYQLITPSECSANLSRFDGVRYGLQVEDPELGKQYKKTRSDGFGAEVKRRILIGTYALSEGFYDAYYLQACKMRAKIASELYSALSKANAILTPTTPTTAFEVGSIQDPLKMHACDLLTIPQGLAGIPAVTFPFGKDGKGRPIGMQLSGSAFSDDSLAMLAGKVEEVEQ